MTKPVQEVIEEMRLRFTSGNSIPVHDARITAEEWQVVTATLSRVQDEYALVRKAADKIVTAIVIHGRSSSNCLAAYRQLKLVLDSVSLAATLGNQGLPTLAKPVLESRVERLEAALVYAWDLADLNCWEVGVHHSSTDLVAQRLTYSCSGCLASVVRSPETNGVALAAMNFPHGADCKYVQFRDLAESVGNDAGEGA